MQILLICGTNRPNSNTHRAASWVAEFIKGQGQAIDFVDFHHFPLPWVEAEAAEPSQRATDQKIQVAKWSERVQRAEAIVIVAPEYNHGYTGVLKNALDLLYAELNYKPVLICGVSAGSLGGARMVEQLRSVLIELRAVPIREAVYFRNSGALFVTDDQTQIEVYKKTLTKALTELLFLAKALTAARAARAV